MTNCRQYNTLYVTSTLRPVRDSESLSRDTPRLRTEPGVQSPSLTIPNDDPNPDWWCTGSIWDKSYFPNGGVQYEAGSITNDTGPTTLVKQAASSMSPHHWPRLLTTCWVFTLCVVWNKSASWSTTQSWSFLSPEWVVQVLTWSPRTSRTNFFQPQPEIDSSARVGMLAPTQVSKKVCQRLVEQVCNPDKEKNYFIMNNR